MSSSPKEPAYPFAWPSHLHKAWHPLFTNALVGGILTLFLALVTGAANKNVAGAGFLERLCAHR